MKLREEILEVFYDNTTFGEKADAILALVAEDRAALVAVIREVVDWYEHDAETYAWPRESIDAVLAGGVRERK